MTIRQILDSLSEQDRRFIQYAFDNQMSQYVEYEKGKFIGVNVDTIKKLNIENSVGVWSIGSIKGASQNES